ncbi:hypothetical protein CF336_g2645 [Tilletia laevis]|uniref:Peptide-methionine (R)-S-oxide reductase n=1 Tax=Tilletia caries TaxID=13290 RepID=A0ABN7IN21_9BASI|nr:hypothetical protein CF336_g2645 [Tilletia laevis]CAD6912990.1 unnamed protein product [Tilletia caries]
MLRLAARTTLSLSLLRPAIATATTTTTTTTTVRAPTSRAISFKSIFGSSKPATSDSTSSSTSSSTGTPHSAMSDSFPKGKSDSEWRAQLSPEQFHILREKGTERPGTGEYNKVYDKGVYECAGCGNPLYKSETKFDSGCGWPAFFEGIPGSLRLVEDRKFGMLRTEMVCAGCGGHVGHVFKGEGFSTPTNERHCANSVSLKFTPAEDGKAKLSIVPPKDLAPR